MSMLPNIHIEIEKDSLYSTLVCSLEKPTLISLKEIAQKYITLSDQISNTAATKSSEYIMLEELSSQIEERKSVIKKVVNNALSNLECEEITIADYGCGQGLASLCLLELLHDKRGNLDNVKNVKLIDKDKVALSRAMLHYSVLFPDLEVIAYEQDFLDEHFSIPCDSILTINIFSNISDYSSICADRITKLVCDGQYLFMHNIFIGDTFTNKQIDHSKNNFFTILNQLLKDNAGCEVLTDKTITNYERVPREKWDNLLERITVHDKVPKHATRYVVTSRRKVDHTCIPAKHESFGLLFPGLPVNQLINVPKLELWYTTPLKGTHYIEQLDNDNKISISHSYVSKDFKSEFTGCLDELNPQTIRKCAEQFYQVHISHALESGMQCGTEILELYEYAASQGVTEAYNNIGVLYSLIQGSEGFNTQDCINKSIYYFKLASQCGSTAAMMNLASLYVELGNQSAAVELYTQAADLKDPHALFNLAIATDFALLGLCQDKARAKDLYLQCIDAIGEGQDGDKPDYSLQNSCCLNLMLLLCEEGANYLDILNVFSKAAKPSKRLKYCKEVMQISHIARFSKDALDIINFNSDDCKNNPYYEYNRALLLYNGIHVSSHRIKLDKDEETALTSIKSLIELVEKNKEFAYLKKYVYRTYAVWISKSKDTAAIEVAWRKAAEEDPDRTCACMMNITVCGNPSQEEKCNIFAKYASGGGCRSCHECTNYDVLARKCPRAQWKLAGENKDNAELYNDLSQKSANQGYLYALYYLGYTRAIRNEHPNFNPSPYYTYLVCPPIEYGEMYPILAKDEYYEYLQAAARIDNTGITRHIIPYVARLRNNEYNAIYWACVEYGNSKNEEMLLWIYDYYKNKIGRSLETYFDAKTLCETEMISYAESIAKITADVDFIRAVANFYTDGRKWYKAKEFYEVALAKGCSEVAEILAIINEEIRQTELANRRVQWDYYDEEPYTWEDSLMDALDGELDAYWNID